MEVASTFAVELYDAPNSQWVDVRPWLKIGTLEIDAELNSRGSLHFELEDLDTPVPLEPTYSMRVRVRDSVSVYFGGVVDTAEKSQAGYDLNDGHEYVVDALDYSRLLARFPINNVYTNMNAGNIVKAIISKLPGADTIDVTNVELGPVIAKAVLPNLTIQEAIDEVARVAMYKWYISADKKVYFFEPRQGALACTWDIDAAAVNAGRFQSIPKVMRETSQYRNLQEVIGGTTVDDNFSFYPPIDKPGIAGTYEPGKTALRDIVRRWSIGKPINMVLQVLICSTADFNMDEAKGNARATLRVSSQPGGGAFYYKQGEPYLYLSDAWTNYGGVEETIERYAPRKGEWFWIKYKSETSVSARIEKTEEWCNQEGLAVEDTIYDISQIEGGSGIYKSVEINDNLKTVKECYERARALLIQYGKVPTVVRYTSRNWGNMAPGRFQSLDIYGYSGKLVTCSKMTIHDINGCILEADFELVGSERFSGLAYLRSMAGGQMARMQGTYKIRENEVVIQHVGYQETLAVSDALACTSVDLDDATAWGTARFNDGGIWG